MSSASGLRPVRAMTDHHHPESRSPQPPTINQQRELRRLAVQTGRTFTPPKTRAEASREISRLRGTSRSTRTERLLDRQGDLPAYGTAVRDDETTGYGSSARWG